MKYNERSLPLYHIMIDVMAVQKTYSLIEANISQIHTCSNFVSSQRVLWSVKMSTTSCITTSIKYKTLFVFVFFHTSANILF